MLHVSLDLSFILSFDPWTNVLPELMPVSPRHFHKPCYGSIRENPTLVEVAAWWAIVLTQIFPKVLVYI